MKLTLQLESAKHVKNSVPTDGQSIKSDQRDEAWRRLEDAWRRANEPGIEEHDQRRRLNWVGGGLVVFGLLTGEDPEVLRSQLERDRPAVEAAPAAIMDGPVTFREGRSTPPPPRHAGAQRPVE